MTHTTEHREADLDQLPARTPDAIVALRISLLYATFGGIWILLSDTALELLVHNPALVTSLQTVKGWFFVGATALLLFAYVSAELRHRAHAERALEQAHHLLSQRVEERTADLQQANADLERALRLKDEFLSNMSHELRTPLNAVLGRAESLQEAIYGPLNTRQRDAVRSIDESGRHLLGLINDILDLSRIDAGRLELALTTVEVVELCAASVQFVQPAARKKRLVISSMVDQSIGMVQLDERRVKQILVNLLNNAVKFTPEGGTVGLEARGDAERALLLFTVWDTGIGIDPADQKRLFRPFEQLNRGLARAYEGSGLGLALVARLVELHGGQITLESAPAQGSRFSLTLPWVPASGRS